MIASRMDYWVQRIVCRLELFQIFPFHILLNLVRFSISFVTVGPLENLWTTMGIGFVSTANLEARARSLFIWEDHVFWNSRPSNPILCPSDSSASCIRASLRTVIIFPNFPSRQESHINRNGNACTEEEFWPLRCRGYVLLHHFFFPSCHAEILIPVPLYYSGPRGFGLPLSEF